MEWNEDGHRTEEAETGTDPGPLALLRREEGGVCHFPGEGRDKTEGIPRYRGAGHGSGPHSERDRDSEGMPPIMNSPNSENLSIMNELTPMYQLALPLYTHTSQ